MNGAAGIGPGAAPITRVDGPESYGSEMRARTLVAQASPSHLRPEATAPSSGVFPVRMSAVLKGVSNYDAVGPGKTLAGDDKGDGLFVLSRK